MLEYYMLRIFAVILVVVLIMFVAALFLAMFTNYFED
jgi:hypothetical protein